MVVRISKLCRSCAGLLRNAYPSSIVNVKVQLRTSVYGRVSRPALFFSTGSSIMLEVSLIGDYFELLDAGQNVRVNGELYNWNLNPLVADAAIVSSFHPGKRPWTLQHGYWNHTICAMMLYMAA
jgi:hypothetical protein